MKPFQNCFVIVSKRFESGWQRVSIASRNPFAMMTPVEDMSVLTSFMFTGCEVLPKIFLPFPRTIGQMSSCSRSMRFASNSCGAAVFHPLVAGVYTLITRSGTAQIEQYVAEMVHQAGFTLLAPGFFKMFLADHEQNPCCWLQDMAYPVGQFASLDK